VHDERVALADGLPVRAGEIADAHAVVQHQLGDVDGDVLGNVRRQALDVDLAVHEVDDAALRLDALRLAREMHRDGDPQHLVHRDAIEVGVQQVVPHRVELVFLHHDAEVAAVVELQRDQRVDARLRVQEVRQRLGIDRDGLGLAALAAVEHRRDLPGTAQAARVVAAARITTSGYERGIHD